MNISRDTGAAAGAPSMLKLGQRLLAVIGLVVVTILAIWLWLSWQQAREAEIKRMTVTVQLLAVQADNYFAVYEQHLRRLARELEQQDLPARPAATRAAMDRLRSALPEVTVAELLYPDGRILASTGGPEPGSQGTSHAKAELERSLRRPGLSISHPQPIDRAPGWQLFLRHAVRDRRQVPRYLVQIGIPLKHQQALWRALDLGPDVALGLLRDDGYLLSRIPDNGNLTAVYGRQIERGALVLATRQAPERGEYEGAVVVGSYRLGVYRRLVRLPLVAFLSQERRHVVGLWWRDVRWPLLLVLGSMGISFVIYILLARRYSGRLRAIEEQLTRGASVPVESLTSSGVREIDMLVAALAQSREKLRVMALNRERLLLTATAAGVYTVREQDDVVLGADEAFAAMLGHALPDINGRRWSELVEERPAESGGEADSGPGLARRIVRVRAPGDDRSRWLSVAEYRENPDAGGSVRHGLAIDVSDREQLLGRVKRQSQRLQALWQLAVSRDETDSEKLRLMLRLAQEVLRMDVVLASELRDGRFTVRESTAQSDPFATGQTFELEDALCQRTIHSRQSVVARDLRVDPDLYRHPLAVSAGIRGYASVPIYTGNHLYGTMAFLRREPLDAEFGADEITFMELLAAWFGQILVEERQRQELERMAMTDGLTHLSNRRAAEGRFQEEIARARREHGRFSVALCDLDHFKIINDQYGHDVGDQVLVQVAGTLKSQLREGDWVARWGGEEFIVFLYQAEPDAAFAAMERLRLAIKGRPVATAHGPLDVTASIGIGTFRGDGDMTTVLSEADGCLYEAKRAGRDTVIRSEPTRRGTLWKAGMLQQALMDQRLVPAYQVIVDLRSRQAVADEALARLVNADGQLLAAGEFIDAAEGINLIHQVDEAITRQSLRRCADNLRTGRAGPDFMHFINLSPQFLARRDLVQAMLAQAAQLSVERDMVGAPVKPVVLEITERQLLGNFDELMKDLRPLLDFGFRLALDDFGSGYSSFLYLASLPVSFLKIEGWMVRNLSGNPKVLAMVKSIIRLAREQGIVTIAECVEDAATADRLTELGVDWGQGWYFGYPQCEVDPAEVARAVRTGTC